MRYPRKWQLAVVCLLALALLPFAPAPRGAAQAPGYTVTDLGTLGSSAGEQSKAYGLDECGRVVGGSQAVAGASAPFRPFLWSDGVMTDLGTLGGSAGTAAALNQSGTVVGSALTSGGLTHPFVRPTGGPAQDIGTLSGGNTAEAYDINASGQVVGVSEEGQLQDRAFIWQSGTMQKLTATWGTPIRAFGINDAGQVAGSANLNTSGTHAFITNGGVALDLGTLGGPVSVATEVNDLGECAGYSHIFSPTITQYFHAFRWKDSNNNGQADSGEMLDLGLLDVSHKASYAYDLNNVGQVVGSSETGTANNNISRAFIWQDANSNGASDPGELQDLNALVPGTGWTFQEARGINDRGQIVGTGLNPDGKVHAFLLTPSLSITSVSGAGTFNGTATLTATLTTAGTHLAGQVVRFKLNGTAVGTAPTNASGVATLSGVSLAGIDAGTYSSAITAEFNPTGCTPLPGSSGTGALTVSQTPTVVSAIAGSGTYNGTATLTATLTAGGPLSGRAISFSLNGTTACGVTGKPACPTTNTSGVATLSGVSLAGINAGNYPSAVAASFAGETSYSGSGTTGGLSVSKATATVTLSNLVHTYDGTAKSANATTDPAGKTVVISYSQSGQPVASPVNVGSYDVTANVSDANYQGGTTGTLTINKATPSINWDTPDGIPYGTALSATQLKATSTVAGTFKYMPAVGDVPHAGTQTLHVDFTPTDAANYNTASKDVSIQVAKVALTVTAHDKSRAYGAANPALTYSINGFVNQDTQAIFTGQQPSLTTTAGSTSAPGPYAIVAAVGTLTAADYTFSFVNGTLTVTKADQTITFGSLGPKTFGDSDFPVSATASSGAEVSFSVEQGGACTVMGSTVHLTGAGSCTITASQVGNDNYNAAPRVPQTFTINRASSTTTVSVGNATYDGQPHGATASVTGAGGLNQSRPVTYTGRNGTIYTSPTTAPTNAGDYTASASFGGDTDHLESSDSRNFQIAKASQTITFDALLDKTFGNPDFTLSATASSGLTVTFSASDNCSVVGSKVHLTGAGSCTITAAQVGTENYQAAPEVQRTFRIAKAATTSTVSSSANPSAVGQSVTFTASVTSGAGTPAGSVQFKVDGLNFGSPVPLNTGGVATLSTSGLTAGNHSVTADFNGSNFEASMGTLAGGQVVGSSFEFAQSLYTVAERGGSISVIVRRMGDTTGAAKVDYVTDDGSIPSVGVPCSSVTGLALERCDYTRAAGTLLFAPGESEKSFVVLVSDDSYMEGLETLRLVLSNPVGGFVTGAQAAATLQLTDDTPESSGNPTDDSSAFVRQHYHDFLNREPDASGLAFWTGEIEQCGADVGCREVKRINVSAAFFLSIEFQQTGYLVYRTYKAAYGDATSPNVEGTVPAVRLQEFLPDTRSIGEGVVVGQPNWEQKLEANKNAYMLEFVQRPQFLAALPFTNAQQFVDKLFLNAGVKPTSAERDAAIAAFGSGNPAGRAAALRLVAENPTLQQAEFRRAFVLMQFYGYLRRNPDDPQDTDFRGWKFWLDKLNQFNGNYVQAEMVKAFLDSIEYRTRFAP